VELTKKEEEKFDKYWDRVEEKLQIVQKAYDECVIIGIEPTLTNCATISGFSKKVASSHYRLIRSISDNHNFMIAYSRCEIEKIKPTIAKIVEMTSLSKYYVTKELKEMKTYKKN